jgi:hypothetical protein
LQTLIELQTFEGFWTLSEELCVAIDVKLAAMQLKMKNEGWDANVLATALAVQFLTTQLADQEESWELVVEKAKGWLEAKGHGEESAVWTAVRPEKFKMVQAELV